MRNVLLGLICIGVFSGCFYGCSAGQNSDLAIMRKSEEHLISAKDEARLKEALADSNWEECEMEDIETYLCPYTLILDDMNYVYDSYDSEKPILYTEAIRMNIL